jgi:hypothetical protein
MRNRHRKQKNPAATFPHELAKPGICQQIEIVRRLYAMGGFSGTNLQPNPQNPREIKHFTVRYAAAKRFKAGKGIAAYAPSAQL